MNDVYLDELFLLTKEINKRKLRDYSIQLTLIQNPHTKDPKELFSQINKLLAEQEEKKPADEEFDSAGFERLKSALSENPKFLVKS